ncbi:erp38 Protein disulfide-isomerase erp38 [Candida maltosa Xu316]|uniref:Thioredoxin domain-containing protein n=1 Tax=Candida maltosa (strain Xu316) TaxID=1245528 RepID=M3JZF3_CANMX|nr:hypothetical protein G210_1025 [Candida maltosa Xu316]
MKKINSFVVLLLSLFAFHAFASISLEPYIIEFSDNDALQPVLERADYSLIYFYSDSCRYCRKFDPVFENLSVLYNNNKDKNTRFQVLKTNARVNQQIGALFQVSQYPTLKLLIYETKEIITYEDDKDLQSIIKYVSDNVDVSPNYENYESKVKYELLNNGDSVVFFITDYLPGWQDYKYPAHFTHQLALDYNGVFETVVIDVGKLSDYELLSRYGISQFPTVAYVKQNEGIVKTYTTNKNEVNVDEIYKFIDNVNDDNETGPWINIHDINTNSQEVIKDDDDEDVFEHIEL